MQLDRMTLGRMAKDMGFVRDTLEKVYRLADVLKFMEEDELLSKSIALKGGTAINLTIFDLPMLSVDIDLDYCKSIEREEMLADREVITDRINKYMMVRRICFVNVLCFTAQLEQSSLRQNLNWIISKMFPYSR